MPPNDRSRPSQGGSSEFADDDDTAIVSPGERDADVTRVTPKTPAERSREYRKRKRDALTEALS